MKKQIIFLSSICIIAFCSCNSSSVKEKINKTGNATGQVIGEFASGVSNGVKKAVEPVIKIDSALMKQGIYFGKISISPDSLGYDNVLVVYVIFNKKYEGDLTAKAFDEKNLEMGRVKVHIKGNKDETTFAEFHFDKHTVLTNESKIIIE